MKNVFDLVATLRLDAKPFEAGLVAARTGLGGGLAKAAKVGMVATAAATAAVVGFGASAVKTGAEFDKSIAQVAATMGKSVEEMAQSVGEVDTAWGHFAGNLRDYAQFLGRNTAFSATQAADALNYMALAGYDTQKSMDMLPNVLNLAAAGAMDLARASDMVTDTETAFGITTKRTAQMVDEMAKAASTGNTSVEQLGDAFLVVGGLAKELNGGMVELKDGTTASVDGIQELEIALTAMANAGVKGSEAGTHMRNMLLKLSNPTSEGVKTLEALGVAVFDTEGNMRSLKDIMGDLSGALENVTQEEKIQAISALFNTRDMASAEALLGAVSQDWDKIGESILNAEGAADKMAKTQLDNLAGDVTLFKSALEGAKIAISDSLSPTLREFVQLGTEGLSDVAEAFKEDGLAGAMESFGEFLSDAITKIVTKLPELIKAVLSMLSTLMKGAGTDIIPQLITAIVEMLPMLVETGIQVVKELINGLTMTIPQLIPVAVEMILELVNMLTNTSTLISLINAAVVLIEALADGIINALPILLQQAPVLINNLISAIIMLLPTIITMGVRLVISLAGGIIQALPNILSAAYQIIPNFIKAIWTNIKELWNVGKEIVSGVWQGIKDNARNFRDNVMNMFKGIVDGVKKVLGIHSPSKVFAQIGEFMAEGIGEGFEDGIIGVQDDINNSLDFSSASITGELPSGSVSQGPQFVLNIYGAVGQDVNELADIIERRISQKMERSGKAYA